MQNFQEQKTKPLLFLHIPKCAGMSLIEILSKQFNAANTYHIQVINNERTSENELRELDEVSKSRIELVTGHFRYGLHEVFDENSDYITWLRDPIKRVVSYYQFVKNNPSHRMWKSGFFHDDLSLKEFILQCDADDVHNGQCRFLSQVGTRENDLLGQAIHNLEHHFSFYGITEYFDESLLMLHKQRGWKLNTYRRINRSGSEKLRLESEIRNLIMDRNKLDIQLYEHGRHSFMNAWESSTALQSQLIPYQKKVANHQKRYEMFRKLKSFMPGIIKKPIKSILDSKPNVL